MTRNKVTNSREGEAAENVSEHFVIVIKRFFWKKSKSLCRQRPHFSTMACVCTWRCVRKQRVNADIAAMTSAESCRVSRTHARTSLSGWIRLCKTFGRTLQLHRTYWPHPRKEGGLASITHNSTEQLSVLHLVHSHVHTYLCEYVVALLRVALIIVISSWRLKTIWLVCTVLWNDYRTSCGIFLRHENNPPFCVSVWCCHCKFAAKLLLRSAALQMMSSEVNWKLLLIHINWQCRRTALWTRLIHHNSCRTTWKGRRVPCIFVWLTSSHRG